MILEWETSINVFMQIIEFPFLTSFSEFVAVSFGPEVLIVASLIVAYVLFRRSKRDAAFFSSVMLIGAGMVKVLKETVRYPRPSNALVAESSFSFPSGHVTMATILLLSVAYLYARHKSRRVKLLSYGLAYLGSFIVAFTRLYLRVHWFRDVVAGVVLATFLVVLAILVFDKKFKYLQDLLGS